MSLSGKSLRVRDDEFGIDLDFNVVDEGNGDPVLFLHGFPDSAEVWREQIGPVSNAGYRVIAPDLRGFGDSARPSDPDPGRDIALYSIQRIVADVIGILHALAVAPPVHVVGHDWGAAVGWVLASTTRSQPLVRSLVAMSVAHPRAYKRPTIAQRQKSWYIYFFQHPRAEHAIARDTQFLRDWSRFPQEVPRWQRDLGRTGALTAALNWYRANASPDPARSLVDAIPELEAKGLWGPVRVPTLGVSSTDDPHLTSEPMRASDNFVANPADWQYQEIPAGHWLQLERPELVNPLLVDFLKSA